MMGEGVSAIRQCAEFREPDIESQVGVVRWKRLWLLLYLSVHIVNGTMCGRNTNIPELIVGNIL